MRTLLLAAFTLGGAVAAPTVGPAAGDVAGGVGTVVTRLSERLTRLVVGPRGTSAGALRLALPPAPWAPADPADSLYRAARAALSDGDFDRAATLFSQIGERFPKSSYAPDALYYQAFALYRTGGTRNLRAALDALRRQSATYADFRTSGDAAALATRIRGELAQQGDADNAERIADDARAATTGCPTGDREDDRTAALNALLQMDGEQALPIIRKVLARRDACSAPLRRRAVFLLAQRSTAETADELMRVAESDPDREVREQAVFWMSQVNTPRATELLAGIVNNSRDAGMQEKALFALSQQGSAESNRLLRDFAGREGASPMVREKAIFWLGQQHSDDNTRFLKSLYGRMQNEDLKEKVLFSLSQQGDNSDWLIDVARNAQESTELRKKALFWAGQGRGLDVDRLHGLYGQLTDRELREQIIFVYSQRRESAAVDRLIAIARSDRDPELRKKAVFWLGQSRDPRAARFLVELIER